MQSIRQNSVQADTCNCKLMRCADAYSFFYYCVCGCMGPYMFIECVRKVESVFVCLHVASQYLFKLNWLFGKRSEALMHRTQAV